MCIMEKYFDETRRTWTFNTVKEKLFIIKVYKNIHLTKQSSLLGRDLESTVLKFSFICRNLFKQQWLFE